MAFLCYPTTLFENHEFEYEIIYMIEDPKYFTYYKYHKQKLVMHRATMRYYYDNCSSNNLKGCEE
jgi:deoxyribodipyrimidine photolyase-related protein